MKKLLSYFLLSVILISSFRIYTFAASFAGGDGTIKNPYLIENYDQLDAMRNNLSAYYALKNDIVFPKGLWTPIGDKENPFTGGFDGRNHCLSGIFISAEIDDALYYSFGLFGYSEGEIKNIGEIDGGIYISVRPDAKIYEEVHLYAGSVVGFGDAENCNCNVEIKFTFNSDAEISSYIGGIVGYGSAVNCANTADISGSISGKDKYYGGLCIGGIAGSGKTVVNCVNYGAISASVTRHFHSDLRAGGICGIGKNIANCVNNGSVTASGSSYSDYIGGICGSIGDKASVSEVCNFGAVFGNYDSHSGGIVGYIGGKAQIENSFNSGIVSGGYAGGIAGTSYRASTVKNCYNAGLADGGQAIAENSDDTYKINCYYLEDMTESDKEAISLLSGNMKIENSFDGFDFETVWKFNEIGGYEYPVLQNVPAFEMPKSIEACNAKLGCDTVIYHTVQPDVTVSDGQTVLSLKKDYILKFVCGSSSWITADMYSMKYIPYKVKSEVIIIGSGAYCGAKKLTFDVAPYDISNATLMTPWKDLGGSLSSSSFDMKNFEYDGTEKVQDAFRLCDECDTIPESEYVVSYKNNIYPGTATITITAAGDSYTGVLEKEFTIYGIVYIKGDCDGDGNLSPDDAIYLLYHVYFPESYPISSACDFNSDGFITSDDAIYLLYHIYFPESYPI